MAELIASNQINPLQPPDKTESGGGGACTATTSVNDAPVNSRTGSSSGQSSLVPPERRHSTSASDWSQSGVLIKKNSVGVSLSNGSGKNDTLSQIDSCYFQKICNKNNCIPRIQDFKCI